MMLVQGLNVTVIMNYTECTGMTEGFMHAMTTTTSLLIHWLASSMVLLDYKACTW